MRGCKVIDWGKEFREKAEELAENEFLKATQAEISELARQAIRSSWLDKAYCTPEVIRKAHKDMMGEDTNEM